MLQLHLLKVALSGPLPLPLPAANFDKSLTEQPAEESPCGTPSTPPPPNIFKDFTYISPGFMSHRLAHEQQEAAAAAADAAAAAADAAAVAAAVAAQLSANSSPS